MLVLTRKPSESILVGDNIEIFVVEVGDGVVKVGIKAPKSVPIYRRELLEAIQKENTAASMAAPHLLPDFE